MTSLIIPIMYHPTVYGCLVTKEWWTYHVGRFMHYAAYGLLATTRRRRRKDTGGGKNVYIKVTYNYSTHLMFPLFVLYFMWLHKASNIPLVVVT
jgi:hypothetical protein